MKNATKGFNGFRNWNHWNVSLWINNDEGLYHVAGEFVMRNRVKGKDGAARGMLDYLREVGITRTPDGAPYSVSSIRVAMRGM